MPTGPDARRGPSEDRSRIKRVTLRDRYANTKDAGIDAAAATAANVMSGSSPCARRRVRRSVFRLRSGGGRGQPEESALHLSPFHLLSSLRPRDVQPTARSLRRSAHCGLSGESMIFDRREYGFRDQGFPVPGFPEIADYRRESKPRGRPAARASVGDRGACSPLATSAGLGYPTVRSSGGSPKGGQAKVARGGRSECRAPSIAPI